MNDETGKVSLEKVFQDIPGLKELANKDTTAAALALKDIKNIRETQGIIDAAVSMWNVGKDHLRRGELGYKNYKDGLAQNDYAELTEIEARIKSAKQTPNFFDAPLQSIVGGVANSAPMMVDSIVKGQAVGIGLGAFGALMGGVVTAETGPGAVLGARAGWSVGYKIGSRFGTAASMWEPIAGNNYLDFKQLKDKNGNPILTDGEARAFAGIAALLETGIEMANFGLIEKALKGTVHQQAVKNIITEAKDNASVEAALKSYLNKNLTNALKIAATETLEEGAQSVSNDLVHNRIVGYKDAEQDIKKYDWSDIGENAIRSMKEALPATIGFGAMAGAGGSLGAARRIHALGMEQEEFQRDTHKTATGINMVKGLQAVLENSELHQKNPDISKEMLTKQLKNSGYETTYIDVEMVIREENGPEILQILAKAAEISEDELTAAIKNNGKLAIPTAVYAQAELETKSDLSKNVSFDENAVAPSREKEEVKRISEEIKSFNQQEEKEQVELTDAIITTLFPEEGKKQDMAATIIYFDPQNPAAAWNEVYKEYIEQENEILSPVLEEINRGMGNGIDIVSIIEDYGGEGKGRRVSKNEKWYSDFYKENKRRPTKQELRDMAYEVATGASDAPDLMGWKATAEEEQAYFKDAKNRLDDIRENLKALEEIKDTVKTLNASEIAMSKGLTKEGYAVYQSTSSILQEMPMGKVKRASRMGAILFARHADRIAKIMQESGKKDYTAKDYTRDRVGVRTGQRESFEGFFQLTIDNEKHTNDNVNISNKIIQNKDGSYSIHLKYIPKEHETRSERVSRRKKEVEDIDVSGLSGNEESAYMQLLSAANRNKIDERIKKGESWEKIVQEYTVKFNAELSNYSENISEHVRILRLNILKGAVLYATRRANIDSDSRGIGSDTGSTIRGNQAGSGTKNNIDNGQGRFYKQSGLSYAQTVNGQIFESDGKRIIELFESADESTFAHEMGHLFVMDLKEMSEIEGAPQWVKQDYETVSEWMAWEEGKAKEYVGTAWEKEFTNLEENIMAAKLAGDVAGCETLKDVFAQERFARGFELYLKSGGAPVNHLKRAFRRFKKWLTDIYKDFAQTGGRPSKEVKAVMSRMLASQEEIDLAAKMSKIKDFEVAGGTKVLDETEQEMYARWSQEAKEEAEEKLLKEVLKDLEGEGKSQREALMEEERQRFKSELEKEKVFTAEKAVELTGDKKAALSFYEDLQSYEAEIAKTGGMKKVMEKHMNEFENILEESKLSPEVMHEQAQKMLYTTQYRNRLIALEYQALAKKQDAMRHISESSMRKIDELEEQVKDLDIEIEFDGENEKAQGIKKKIAEIRFSAKWRKDEMEALEKLQNANGKDALKETIKGLRKTIREGKSNLRLLRDAAIGKADLYERAAKEAMREMPVGNAVNFKKWIRKEREQIALINRLMAVGNFEVAMLAKERQLSFAAMASQAYKNQDHVKKITEKIRRQVYSKVKLPATERYYHNHIAYLFGIIKRDAFEPVKELNESLSQVFQRLNETLDTIGVPEWVIAATSGKEAKVKGFTGLTIHELEEVRDVLSVLYITGRDKFKLKTIEGKEISEAVNEIVTCTDAVVKRRVKINKVEENENELGSYINSILKAETFVSVMDGYKDGPTRKYLFDPIAKADLKEGELRPAAQKRLEEILSGYTTKERISIKNDKRYAMTSDPEEEGKSGAEMKLTKENLLCFALNYGNKINKVRLIQGLGINEATAQNTLKNLDERDWKFVQDIWDFINEYWQETVAIEERMNGVTLQKVEALPFTIADKDGKVHSLKGGYYPIKANPEKSSRVADYEADNIAQAQMSGYAALGTGRGFTKERSKSEKVKRELLLEFKVIPEHLDNVIHNITHREAVRDAYRVVTDKNFESVIRKHFGGKTHEMLKEWVVDNWRVQKRSNGFANIFTDQTLSKLRSRATIAIMGYRASTSLLNVANIMPMMDELGAEKAVKAVSEYYKDPTQNRKFVLSKSQFLRGRVTNMDRDLKEAYSTLYPSSVPAVDCIKKHAFDMIAETDLMLSLPTWKARYIEAFERKNKENEIQKIVNEQETQKTEKLREEMAEKMPEPPELPRIKSMIEIEQEAILEADRVVRNIFGSGKTKDLAAIQKGSELVKGMTVFYSFFNVQFNAVAKAYFQKQNTGDWKPLAKAVFYRLFLMTVIETMIRQMLISGDDDDKYGGLKAFAKNLAGSATGGLWGIRDVANIALNLAFQGTDYGRGYQMSLATQIVDRGKAMAKTFMSLSDENGKKDWIDLGRDTNKVINAGVGMPDTITDSVWTTMRYMTDKEYEITLSEYLRALIFDKKLKGEK